MARVAAISHSKCGVVLILESMWERIVTVIVRATPSFCLTCTRERLMSILEGVWNERDNCAPGQGRTRCDDT